ncbi:MAG TPA: rhomboid family intramembrane serine protease [Coriobacteriia bacterium]
MFPIRDENPTSRITWMTWLIIAINLAVFGYEFWLSLTAGVGVFDEFVIRYSFVPARFFASPFSPREWATVLTAMFMHGGWLHVGGNMLYLWIFGNNIEDRLGSARFLGFYLAAGLAATAAQAIVSPTSALPTLGASGAVAGVLAAYLLLYPRARVTTLVFIFFFIEVAAIPAYLIIIVWFVIQLGSGLGSLGQATAAGGGVAYFAHIGGFIAGLALALPVWWVDRQRSARFTDWR